MKNKEMKNKVIAIILARGGSKGIPRKNVLEFSGHPLIAWSVMQAKKTKEIDEVYISSDSDEILEIGQNYGAIVIKRPDKYAGDNAKSEEAILHALEVLGSDQDIIIMLEPTAPLRKPNDLGEAVKMFRNKGWDSCFSGATLQDFLIWKKDKNGELISVNYDYKNQGPRQMREPDYVENGAIYMFKPEIMIKDKNRFGGKIGIFPNHFWQSFEIDDPEDWDFVELVFNKYLLQDYKDLGFYYEITKK
jgi:CMP-N,N'-diacetyllegionaminic acid synthase